MRSFSSFLDRRMAVRRALSCKGWTSRAMLRHLYDLLHECAGVDGDILEIGSAWGRSTVLLLLASDRRLCSIDPHTGGRALIERNEEQGSREEFDKNMRRYGLRDRVDMHVKTTQAVLDSGELDDRAFAFAFIDGLHTGDGVQTDFDFAYPRLNAGGIMAFDDYFAPNIPDYTARIDQIADEEKLALVRDSKTKLVFFRK